MTVSEYDTIVVGGGPIGSYIAKNIAKEKHSVALFEKDTLYKKPLSCAGLVSSRVFDFTGDSSKEAIQNKIKGANIHSPSDIVLKIGGDRIHALVIDRRFFDEKLMVSAKKEGVDIHLGYRVTSTTRNKKQVEIKTSKNINVKSSLIIGADGPFSKIRNEFINYDPKEYLLGIGAEVTNVDLDPDFVEIFVGNNIAPGFFAWIIPTNKKGTTARVGLCTIQNMAISPKAYFKKLFLNEPSKNFLKDAEIKENIGGVIPLGFLKKTYDDNIMVVGDAAAQVKPTSGGGIFPGLACAKHCVSTALECIKRNDFSQKNLKEYHKKWTKEIGNELNRGMKFRGIYKTLSDDTIDKYIKKFNNQKIIEAINEYGDIDFPSKLVKPLFKKAPSLIRLFPSILKD